jgi:hypothetical protein
MRRIKRLRLRRKMTNEEKQQAEARRAKLSPAEREVVTLSERASAVYDELVASGWSFGGSSPADVLSVLLPALERALERGKAHP